MSEGNVRIYFKGTIIIIVDVSSNPTNQSTICG